jgi:hypothetical protein
MSRLPGLTEQEYALAQLRAGNMTPAEIAGASKLPLNDVYNILSSPTVRALIAELRAARLAPMLDMVETEVERSVKTLADVRDNAIKDADRIKASTTLLDWFHKLHETVDVLPRIAGIEARLNASSRYRLATGDGPKVVESLTVPDGLVADDVLPSEEM